MKTLLSELIHWLVYVLVGTATGAIGGGFIAGLGSALNGEYFTLGLSFGLPIGTVLGCILSFIAYPFTRHVHPGTVIRYLGSGTLVPATLLVLVPGIGPGLAMLGAPLGFTCATVILVMRSRGISNAPL